MPAKLKVETATFSVEFQVLLFTSKGAVTLNECPGGVKVNGAGNVSQCLFEKQD